MTEAEKNYLIRYCLVGLLFVLLVGSPIIFEGIYAKDSIRKCEALLPRNQHCRTTAEIIPEETK